MNNPRPLTAPDPLYLDLRDDGQPAPWAKLLAGCGADLGIDTLQWLRVRDQVSRLMERGQSVNLVVTGHPQWRGLIEHLKADRFPHLGLVNLEQGSSRAAAA